MINKSISTILCSIDHMFDFRVRPTSLKGKFRASHCEKSLPFDRFEISIGRLHGEHD